MCCEVCFIEFELLIGRKVLIGVWDFVIFKGFNDSCLLVDLIVKFVWYKFLFKLFDVWRFEFDFLILFFKVILIVVCCVFFWC